MVSALISGSIFLDLSPGMGHGAVSLARESNENHAYECFRSSYALFAVLMHVDGSERQL